MPTDYKGLGERQSGDPNIMKLKDVNKLRPLDNIVAGWRQHGIEHPSDPEQWEAVVCPGPRSCPLDRKPVDASGNQRFPISRRFAANVWDYDTASVKVLVAGPQIFEEFKGVATVGIDPASCDWTITKSGQGKGTKYDVIRHDASPFGATVVTPDMLHDVTKYEQPHSAEHIFEVLDKFGIDYDSLSMPSYTYEEALAFKMPYTKHRGETIEEILSSDPGFCEWLHGTKLEQGQLGDPVFLALQTAMEERGMVQGLEEAISLLPEPEMGSQSVAQGQAQSATTTETPAMSPAASNMVPLIGPDGNQVMVPPTAVDHMLKGGFSRPQAQTPVDANAPMKVLVGGQEVELPREQALMLIAAGTAAELDESVPEPKPEPPKLPLPDEIVNVDVAGTVVPMPYVQGAMVVDNPASSASFADPDVQVAHDRVKAQDPRTQGSESPSTDSVQASESSPVTADGSTRGSDLERPFECDQCEAHYKTQGALTQHKNREHKAAEPQPSAVPAGANGSGLAERVKDKIARAPFARDFTKMLQIFDEEVGKRNFTDFTDDELSKIEARIDREIAQAAQV